MNVERAILLLRQLLESCEDRPCWLDFGHFSVVLKASVPFQVLRALEEEEIFVTIDRSGLRESYLKGDDGEVHKAEKVSVRLVNQVERMVIVQDVGDLLKLSKAHQSLPKAYVVWSHDAKPDFYDEASPETIPKRARSYHTAICLWNLLKGHCHHQDNDSDSLLFFGTRRVEISPGIVLKDLTREVDIEGAVAFMADGDRKEMRKEILISRLSEHLKHQDAQHSFSYLFSTFKVFTRGLREAMAIYLADHSPELLAEEAAKAAVDYTEKLEKIVSGLEAKSLTVPVALFFAYTEIKPANLGNNVVIAFTALLYFTAMGWVWYTQSTLLDLLHKTIKAKSNELKTKGLDEENPIITETLQTLERRANSSETFAGVMLACSVCPFLFAIVKWIWAA